MQKLSKKMPCRQRRISSVFQGFYVVDTKTFHARIENCYGEPRRKFVSKDKTFPTVPLKEVPAHAEGNKAEGHRPVVLVVDDESVIADTLSELLKRSG